MELGNPIAAVRTTASPTCPFCNVATSQYRSMRGGPWELCAVNYGWFYDRPITHHIEYERFEKFFRAKHNINCINIRSAYNNIDSLCESIVDVRHIIQEESRRVDIVGAEEPSFLKQMRRRESVLVKELETTKQKRDKWVEKLPSWLKDKTGVTVELPYEALEVFNTQDAKLNVVNATARMEALQARTNYRATRAIQRDIQEHVVDLLSDESDDDYDEEYGSDNEANSDNDPPGRTPRTRSHSRRPSPGVSMR